MSKKEITIKLDNLESIKGDKEIYDLINKSIMDELYTNDFILENLRELYLSKFIFDNFGYKVWSDKAADSLINVLRKNLCKNILGDKNLGDNEIKIIFGDKNDF